MAQYDGVFRSMYHICETIGSGSYSVPFFSSYPLVYDVSCKAHNGFFEENCVGNAGS